MPSLYIHVPFCVRKCNYCDFVSYPYDRDSVEEYLSGLCQEIELYGDLLSEDEKVASTIYFGGGTPSLLPEAGLEKIFNALAKIFIWDETAEITIEANPGTLTPEKLRTLRQLGCNRLSMGVQSFDPEILARLGRIHCVEDVHSAFAQASAVGFENISIDLISGVPGQSLEGWAKTLLQAVELGPEHISAYSLKIEEGTPFGDMKHKGTLVPVEEELDLEIFLHTVDFLKSQGYEHYEISNFCHPGRESKHNLTYWRNQDYLGLGPAAHSKLRSERFNNFAQLGTYKQVLTRLQPPVEERTIVDLQQEISETVFLGLRLIKGVDLHEFRQRYHQPLEELFPDALVKLRKLGLVEIVNGCLRLTRRGLPLGNEVFAEFL